VSDFNFFVAQMEETTESLDATVKEKQSFSLEYHRFVSTPFSVERSRLPRPLPAMMGEQEYDERKHKHEAIPLNARVQYISLDHRRFVSSPFSATRSRLPRPLAA
jgi:hypothetical protein